MELVQLALPTYNGADYIGQSLVALLAQTHENIVIHVMDNASTDGTSDIVADFARNDRRVVHHHSNQFVSATANWVRAFAAIDQSASRYFMWASDDDLWDREYIGKLVSDLERDAEAVLAFPQYREIDEEGNWGGVYYGADFPKSDRFNQIRRLIIFGRYSALYGVIRMSALDWCPILHEASFGSDLWFLMKLSSAGPFIFRPETLFYKRSGGISETNSDSSASADPQVVWILDEAERQMIMSLDFSRLQNSYLYHRLCVSGKILHPNKSFGPLVSLWAACLLLSSNPRAFGVRRRLLSPFKVRK